VKSKCKCKYVFGRVLHEVFPSNDETSNIGKITSKTFVYKYDSSQSQ
jgi:hypothetical protein